MGTHKDNTLDCYNKNREYFQNNKQKDSKNYNSKLTEKQVIEIRRLLKENEIN